MIILDDILLPVLVAEENLLLLVSGRREGGGKRERERQRDGGRTMRPSGLVNKSWTLLCSFSLQELYRASYRMLVLHVRKLCFRLRRHFTQGDTTGQHWYFSLFFCLVNSNARERNSFLVLSPQPETCPQEPQESACHLSHLSSEGPISYKMSYLKNG